VFRFGACVAYENDPDGDRGPLFYTYQWTVTADDQEAAWLKAFDLVRAKGIEHGTRLLSNADLGGLSLDDLNDILLTVGVHMVSPVLLSPEETSDLVDGE
jgi:hypothetical protein